MSANVIRVLVVDDHPVVRDGLISILETQPDMKVSGEAGTADEAFAAFVAQTPDVTIMDLRLPGASGLDATVRLLARWPAARIIMFTSYARDEQVYDAMKAGAWSYIPKGAPWSELVEAIRSAHAGRRYVSPEIGRNLAQHMSQPDDGLTTREREVLQQMFEGRTNKEIGSTLGISEHTVSVHVRRILDKLGVGSRTEAVTQALRKGLLTID